MTVFDVPSLLTEDDVRAVVDAMLTTRTQRALADEIGVSAAYLNDYLHFRREPGAKLLDGLGLRRVPMYERLTPNAEAVRAAIDGSERAKG